MSQYREEVVTTTTTAAPPSVESAPISVNNPWAATTERVQEVTVDSYGASRLSLYRILQGFGALVALVEGLIAIRFILRLFGANAEAGFAQLIYGVTAPLVAPFVGLFGTPKFQGSAFEVTSLVAIIIYALLAWVIVKVVIMFLSESRTGTVTRRTNTRMP